MRVLAAVALVEWTLDYLMGTDYGLAGLIWLASLAASYGAPGLS